MQQFVQFQDRKEAGKLLASKLQKLHLDKNAIVLAIPRGGVVVANQASSQRSLTLDIVVIKKIGAPSNPELAIGAVGPKTVVFWDRDLIKQLGISKIIMNRELRIKKKEQEDKELILRGNKPFPILKGKTVILVDDGVATGATAMAACKFLRKEKAKRIILAIPVISKTTFETLKLRFDDIIALQIEEEFQSVGQFYKEFQQVTDKEVIEILKA